MQTGHSNVFGRKSTKKVAEKQKRGKFSAEKRNVSETGKWYF